MVNTSSIGSRSFRRNAEWNWPVFLVLALAYSLYFQTFGHEWTLDDLPVIVANTDIRSIKGLLEDTYPGRPLREITFWVDHSLFGMNPGPWHVQQIFWHALNGVLLWFLVRRLGASRFAAWVAAVLFVVHPLQVEVVANISNRKDSLALAFCLMAMLGYMQFLQTDRRYAWLGASLALYLLACSAKQNALLLPAGFMAYEYAFVRTEKRFLLSRPNFFRYASIVSGVGAVGGFLWFGGFSQHKAKIEPFLVEMNLTPPFREADYFGMVLKGWSFMAKRMVWPSELAPEYVFGAPASWLDPWVLSSALIAVFMLFALVWSRSRSSMTFFALIWFLVFFLPISNIWPLNYFAADRYYYAPLSAVCILAGVAFQQLYRKHKALTLIVMLSITALLALTTFRQARVWQSPATLWSHAVKVNPASAVALNNMGQVASARRDFSEAESWYLKAAKVNSSRPMPRHNLGWTYEKLGNHRMALYYFQQFLARVPYSSDPAHYQAAIEVREHLERRYGVKF